jgi:hypothetical protein
MNTAKLKFKNEYRRYRTDDLGAKKKPNENADLFRIAAHKVYKTTHRPIICVSEYNSGREEFTGFLDDCPEEILSGLLGSECYACSGSGVIQDANDDECECDSCGGSGRDDEPRYQASLYLGDTNDLRDAKESNSHPSHWFSENLKELCLGDFI